jgi:FtsH-binding integral membrane protein
MSSNAQANETRTLNRGCLVVFGLPFAGFGVFALIMAVREFLNGNWKEGLLAALFGVVFSGVGFGVIGLGVFGSRLQKAEQQRRAAHPDAPWLWRDDWARGEIKSGAKAGAIVAWVFALFWNIISMLVFLAVLKDGRAGKAIAIAAVFPVIGIWLLVRAATASARRKRFGDSVFKMTSMPGVIGGPLAGVIHPGRPLHSAGELRLRLVCLERDTSGDSTSENVEWEDEKIFGGEVARIGDGIPVVFNIPFECAPTATHSGSRSTVWRLHARATVPGNDYIAEFEVPVFKTAQSRVDAAPVSDPAAAYEKPIDAESSRGVRIRPAATGGTEFHFAAARNKRMAFGLTMFTAFWVGGVVLMIRFHAPILFPIIFGLIAVLLVLGIIGMWTGASHVVAGREGLAVTHWYCFWSWKRMLPAADVERVELKIGMSAGAAAYYDLMATTTAGKKEKLASSIEGKRQAEWLAQEIRNALARR